MFPVATLKQLRNPGCDPRQHSSFEIIDILIEKAVNFSE